MGHDFAVFLGVRERSSARGKEDYGQVCVVFGRRREWPISQRRVSQWTRNIQFFWWARLSLRFSAVAVEAKVEQTTIRLRAAVVSEAALHAASSFWIPCRVAISNDIYRPMRPTGCREAPLDTLKMPFVCWPGWSLTR